jgi:hypothetical protein
MSKEIIEMFGRYIIYGFSDNEKGLTDLGICELREEDRKVALKDVILAHYGGVIEIHFIHIEFGYNKESVFERFKEKTPYLVAQKKEQQQLEFEGLKESIKDLFQGENYKPEIVEKIEIFIRGGNQQDLLKELLESIKGNNRYIYMDKQIIHELEKIYYK